MRKVCVTVTFRGEIEVSDDDFKRLKKDDVLDACELDLNWDEVVNLDGEVEMSR